MSSEIEANRGIKYCKTIYFGRLWARRIAARFWKRLLEDLEEDPTVVAGSKDREGSPQIEGNGGSKCC